MYSLSKSKYTSYCQCPKMLWLDTYKHSEREYDDASAKLRLETGTEVGRLAHQLFPRVVDVTTKNPNGQLDLTAMIARTMQEMASGTPVIAEAAFLHDRCFCAVDLLERTIDGWAIHEVKSSSFQETGNKKSELKKYAPDIAFQKWVLTRCGVNVTGTFLVCLNTNYVRHGALDIQQLFAHIDMHELVENELLKVPSNVTAVRKMLADSQNEPSIDLSRNCDQPYPCPFWEYCTRHLPKDNVFTVYGGSFLSKAEDRFFIDKKLEHYYAGHVSFDQLQNQPLGFIQRIQVEQQTHIDRDAIHRFLNTLRYPLFFLDFETMQFAIPQYDDSKPYQQITFQYSLHVVNDANTICSKQGYGYLAPSDGSDPRRKLAEDLCEKIPMGACTVVYNDIFEKSRIKEMAAIYPDLHDHLMSIRDGICDLLVPFRAGHYYLPTMGGSFSIKSVLPALYPGDPELDYHQLNMVQNGSDAMTIFPQIKDMPPAKSEAARNALLQYCNLDTWAMVKVWEKLKEIV